MSGMVGVVGRPVFSLSSSSRFNGIHLAPERSPFTINNFCFEKGGHFDERTVSFTADINIKDLA